MAATNLNFAAAVDQWVKDAEDRTERVWKESAQEINSIAVQNLSGGVVNVQTGFLRASERASTESMPKIDPKSYPVGDGPFNFDSGQISLVIKNAKLGQTIYLGWTAAYSGFIEWGTSKMAPRGFVRLAAAQWQTVVNKVTERAKGRASAQ